RQEVAQRSEESPDAMARFLGGAVLLDMPGAKFFTPCQATDDSAPMPGSGVLMPKRQLILRILFGNAIAFCALTASGQQSNATVRSLSLRDCIETALEHNLNLQIARLSPALARDRHSVPQGHPLPPPT